MLIVDSAIAGGALALKLGVDTESVLFAILDIFNQGIVGYWLLLSHDSTPEMYAPTLSFFL